MRIFYLMSCDVFKQWDSMRVLFIGTSQQKLKAKISKEIKAGAMEYKRVVSQQEYEEGNIVRKDVENSPEEQAKLFEEDWKKETRETINNNLNYGYFSYTLNNEEM